MSTEASITSTDADTETNFAMETTEDPTTWFNESQTSSPIEEFLNDSSTESVHNTSVVAQHYQIESTTLSLFEAFIIIEIVMTALELLISVVAAIKMPRWRRNYRNQMLMHLSLARFIKRVIFLFKFFEDNRTSHRTYADKSLYSAQVYIDFVIVFLVLAFIKHMYDSLIIVVVKINQNNLNKILACAWMIPVPITAVWSCVIVTEVLNEWMVYLLICCLIRWPMIFLGTSLYITILYRVLSEKIRKFARSLTIVTFLMCLVTNFYLFSKDVIELWCLRSFLTLLVSYLSGFLLNFLILCFYVILIILNFNHNTQFSRSLKDTNSQANVAIKC